MKYNLYIVLYIAIQLIVCGNTNAATYDKLSESLIKVTETTESSETLNISQIEHEIAGIDADILRIEESYTKQRGEFEARKARYEAMLLKCEELEIKEPIIIDNIEKPIETPTEPDNG